MSRGSNLRRAGHASEQNHLRRPRGRAGLRRERRHYTIVETANSGRSPRAPTIHSSASKRHRFTSVPRDVPPPRMCNRKQTLVYQSSSVVVMRKILQNGSLSRRCSSPPPRRPMRRYTSASASVSRRRRARTACRRDPAPTTSGSRATSIRRDRTTSGTTATGRGRRMQGAYWVAAVPRRRTVLRRSLGRQSRQRRPRPSLGPRRATGRTPPLRARTEAHRRAGFGIPSGMYLDLRTLEPFRSHPRLDLLRRSRRAGRQHLRFARRDQHVVFDPHADAVVAVERPRASTPAPAPAASGTPRSRARRPSARRRPARS